MTHENKEPGAGMDEPGAPQQPPMPQPTMADPAPAPTGSGPGAAAAADAAALQGAALQGKVNDLTDRLLRAHAEMDNMRKRLEREKADAHKYAVTKFAHDVITVGDNFQRAIDTVPAGAADQSPALKSFLEGVMMTERELINVLERHGIKRIDPKGEMFNPHHHQAVMEMPNPDVPSGTITQVFQPGYMIEERVLRPAMVVVAKGGYKPVKTPVTPPQPSAEAANDDAPKPGAGGGEPQV